MHEFFASHWRSGMFAILGLPIVAYVVVGLTIGRQVENHVARAQGMHDGESVVALLTVARSNDTSLPERNHAIWALGQLGPRDALPVLEALVTGEKCDHESVVCQRELEKALALCSGATNIGAVLWRRG